MPSRSLPPPPTLALVLALIPTRALPDVPQQHAARRDWSRRSSHPHLPYLPHHSPPPPPGLTPRCESAILEQTYPENHQQWKRRGRTLTVCNTIPAFGNHISAFPLAITLAILFDRAVILECDLPDVDAAAATIGDSFSGPYFDWRLPLPDIPKRRPGAAFGDVSERSTGTRHHPSSLRTAEPTPSPPFSAEGTPLEVVNAWLQWGDESAADQLPNRIRLVGDYHDFKFNSFMLNRHDIFLWATKKIGSLVGEPFFQGCMLRYVLSPNARLQAEVARYTNGLARMPSGALAAAALHIRTGDAVFHPPTGNKFEHQSRSDATRSDPNRTFACAERTAEALLPCGDANSLLINPDQPDTQPALCPVVVVSDSDEMAKRAKHRLAGAIVTQGHAENAIYGYYPKEAELKTYVDWLLMADAEFVLTTASSTFSGTAIKFRDALAPIPAPQAAYGGIGLGLCKDHFSPTSSVKEQLVDTMFSMVVVVARAAPTTTLAQAIFRYPFLLLFIALLLLTITMITPSAPIQR